MRRVHKVVLHPQIGAIEVDCQALVTEDQSQVLLVLTAAPHSEDEEKLRLLSVLGTQEFASDEGSYTVRVIRRRPGENHGLNVMNTLFGSA